MCDIPHSYVWHASSICVTWLIYVRDMTYFRVTIYMRAEFNDWHHMCDMTHPYVWRVSFMCVTWLIHICDVTYSSVWHDSFICLTELIDKCLFMCVQNLTINIINDGWLLYAILMCVISVCTELGAPWLTHMCDMTHSYMWHDSFTCVTWLIHMCDMTHS